LDSLLDVLLEFEGIVVFGVVLERDLHELIGVLVVLVAVGQQCLVVGGFVEVTTKRDSILVVEFGLVVVASLGLNDLYCL
jgi:hypothetical protein